MVRVAGPLCWAARGKLYRRVPLTHPHTPCCNTGRAAACERTLFADTTNGIGLQRRRSSAGTGKAAASAEIRVTVTPSSTSKNRSNPAGRSIKRASCLREGDHVRILFASTICRTTPQGPCDFHHRGYISDSCAKPGQRFATAPTTFFRAVSPTPAPPMPGAPSRPGS